jgi:septal ring factor EnvC (AmiA/AmiB activator)
MNRLAVLAALLLAQTGCLRPFTTRLDRANEHLEYLRGELARGNAQLEDSNERLRKMEQHMEDIRRKMGTMERFLKRFGAGTEVEAEGPPTAPADAAALPAPAAPR